MNASRLESILKHLPEPSYADFYIIGGFDYSSLLKQVQEINQGIKNATFGEAIMRIENPAKQTVMELYTRSLQKYTELLMPGKQPLAPPKILSLKNVFWELPGDVNINITPREVLMDYDYNNTPSYVKEIMKELGDGIVLLKYVTEE